MVKRVGSDFPVEKVKSGGEDELGVLPERKRKEVPKQVLVSEEEPSPGQKAHMAKLTDKRVGSKPRLEPAGRLDIDGMGYIKAEGKHGNILIAKGEAMKIGGSVLKVGLEFYVLDKETTAKYKEAAARLGDKYDFPELEE